MHTFDPDTPEAKADQCGLHSEFHGAHSQTLYRESLQNYFKIGHENRQKFLKRKVARPLLSSHFTMEYSCLLILFWGTGVYFLLLYSFYSKIRFHYGTYSGAEWQAPTSGVLEAAEEMQAENPGIHLSIKWAHLLHKMQSGLHMICMQHHQDSLTCKDMGVFHLQALILNMFTCPILF